MEHWQAVGLDVINVLKYFGPLIGSLLIFCESEIAIVGIVIYAASVWGISQ